MPRRRARRSPARWLAPIALLAAIFVVYTVVNGSLTGSGDDSKAKTTKTQKLRLPKNKFHRVKPGEVLSGIAGKYGMTVERLERLNPDLDAQSLHPGQRVRLRK